MREEEGLMKGRGGGDESRGGDEGKGRGWWRERGRGMKRGGEGDRMATVRRHRTEQIEILRRYTHTSPIEVSHSVIRKKIHRTRSKEV